jgi:16S rRNA processing protein RimM
LIETASGVFEPSDGDIFGVTQRAPQRLPIGKVTRPHGIAGELKVQLAPEYAGALDGVKRIYLDDDQPYRLRSYRYHQGAALIKLDGLETRNEAEALRGARIFVHIKDLPPLPVGQFYSHELIGLRVLRESGELLGELTEVLATGSNDVYVVQTGASELLLPALDSVVRALDVRARTMTVIVPDGLE